MLRTLICAFALMCTAFTLPADEPLPAHIQTGKESFIECDGAKLYTRTFGKGKPLLVIHGGPGLSQDYLLPQLNQLAETHRVIFYDQRGGGRSTGEITSETMTVERFVKDIEAIRNAMGLERFCILGHSWGGFIAMQYAIAHPEAVEKLILSNSIPATSKETLLFAQEARRRFTPFAEEMSRVENSPAFLQGDPQAREKQLRLLFSVFVHATRDVELLSLRMTPTASQNYSKINPIFTKGTLLQPYDLTEKLKELKIPTLIIHGEADPIPLSSAEQIHQAIPNSQLVLIKACGHFPYVEQPQSFFNTLNEFL